MPSAISLNTPIEDLHSFKIARLGQILARKLAAALASQTNKKHFSEATVEDLLSYLPMRYEDRSHLATIKDLEAGMEATLELQVKHAGGYQVRNKKSFSKSRLFIFEVSGVDLDNTTGRLVVCLWTSCLRDRPVLHKETETRSSLHNVWRLGMGQTSRYLFTASATS